MSGKQPSELDLLRKEISDKLNEMILKLQALPEQTEQVEQIIGNLQYVMEKSSLSLSQEEYNDIYGSDDYYWS